MKRWMLWLLLVALPAPRVHAQGYILWDEGVNGPLSNDYPVPTQFGSLSAGTYSILGSVQAIPNEFGWILANDTFTFRVPDGLQIQGVTLTVNQQILAWLGPNFGTEIGHRFTSTSESLMPFFGGSPLPAGDYAMYMSDRDHQAFPTSVNYRLDFVVAPVPEPSTWALFALGGAAFAWGARRHHR